jgi:DNA-binding NarL/FixJ family response regulator
VAKIRVVLADHHHGMIAIIRRILGEEFEVVGAVEDGEQAVDAVRKLDPDAVVIDISMPILIGLQAVEQLQTANCQAKVIFLTLLRGPEFLEAAFSAGASGFVTKAHLSTDLIPAIHEAMLGHTFVSGSLPM